MLHEKCTFPVKVGCVDFSVTTPAITIVMQNGAGRDMLIRNLSANGDSSSTGRVPKDAELVMEAQSLHVYCFER